MGLVLDPVSNISLKPCISLTKYLALRYFGRLSANTAETG